jgi:hypothetical protein
MLGMWGGNLWKLNEKRNPFFWELQDCGVAPLRGLCEKDIYLLMVLMFSYQICLNESLGNFGA